MLREQSDLFLHSWPKTYQRTKKQAASVVIRALKMKKKTISLYLIDRDLLKDY